MNICFQVGKSQRYEGGSDGACDEASVASAEKQRLISFLQKSIKEKEKAIREK